MFGMITSLRPLNPFRMKAFFLFPRRMPHTWEPHLVQFTYGPSLIFWISYNHLLVHFCHPLDCLQSRKPLSSEPEAPKLSAAVTLPSHVQNMNIVSTMITQNSASRSPTELQQASSGTQSASRPDCSAAVDGYLDASSIFRGPAVILYKFPLWSDCKTPVLNCVLNLVQATTH